MISVFRTSSAALTLAVCAGPLSAQSNAMQVTPSARYVLVVDHDFTTPEEFVRVFLQDGQVYRAELNSPNALLEIRGVVRTTQAPHVYPFLSSETPSGTTLLEIYPGKDAEYEIRSRGITGDQLPTRLRLYRDVQASSRREYVRANHAWDIGVELAAGWHSGFAQSGAVQPSGSDPDGGTDFEGCFTARGAQASSRLAVCALGLGYQSQHGARSILWVYSEPRIRLLRVGRAAGSSWEMGPLFRVGLGMISASSDTPVILAPGGYLARHFRATSHSGGWSLQASYSRAFYKGFPRATGAEPATPSGDRLALGVGWYR